MMGSSLYLFMFIRYLFLLSIFHVILATKSYSSMQTLCHDDESSALLKFKQSLSINYSASADPSDYPKVAFWKIEGERSNCCLWDGVECDEDTGRVIGLDLANSFLYGSINSSSSLFSLVHLQRLNLADNDFNYSQIPPEIGLLSRLTTLNLSNSLFTGQLPLEISKLTQLASLDLSGNTLKLQQPSLGTLVQNLTVIKELSLSNVSISSAVPDALANLSSLTSLILDDCGLRGEFPTGIFHLPELQLLSLQSNENLTGYLPEFHRNSPLRELSIVRTSFSGKLPYSIGNLHSLNQLYLSECYFSGSLPASLGNLTQLTSLVLHTNNFTGRIPSLESLSQLTYLSLSLNKFDGGSLPWIGKLTKLTQLYLYDVNLYGEVPSSLANLTELTLIRLGSNHLSGQIPPWLTNLTQLTSISLASNQLQGPIPSSFSELRNLEYLNLHYNNLDGIVEAHIFLGLKNLTVLQLSYNNLLLLTTNSTSINNTTLPKLKYLGLCSFNLREIPNFLRFQDELEVLVLDRNKIHGQIPEWMWNRSKETTGKISLSYNFLTGFDQNPVILPWGGLRLLDLSYNMLQGSLPAPPPNTLTYQLSNNKLTGEISTLICQASSLYKLDLSNNDLSGTIPPCVGNFSNSLLVLNLKGNNFHGTIPQTHRGGNNLRMMDLSQNQLEGHVPRSLANCTMLEILDLGGNQIEDTFPFWLGGLSELQVLVLRSNFHGAMGSTNINLEFPKLRIIDLSDNGFTGDLPLEYFKNWNTMKIFNVDWMAYMQANITFQLQGQGWKWEENYPYSMTMTNKGVRLVYEKILNIFTAIDLSSNKFQGGIPEYIGNLKGLQLLNLSNNALIGCIPPSLGNLTKLESLDLSQNKLSGEIPQTLQLLTFLAFLNVSSNQLIGPIPRGKQFDTFENSSYEGNSGLCGDPLSKKCGNLEVSTPPTDEQGSDSEFPSGVDWIVIFMGYGSGLIVGFIIGRSLTTRHHKWFVEVFGRNEGKRRRHKKRGRGN